jgi:hypothetical protein
MAAIARELTTLKQQSSDLGFLEKSLMNSEQRGEKIGNILIVTMLSHLNPVQTAAERIEQEQRNLQLAFLLAAHQRDYGRLSEEAGSARLKVSCEPPQRFVL